MKLATIASIAAIALLAAAVRAEAATLINPTKTACQEEVARLPGSVPESAKTGDYRVKLDGKEIPCQLGEADGKNWIWVAASLEAGETKSYVAERGRPSAARPLVSVERQGDALVLGDGPLFAKVRLRYEFEGNAGLCTNVPAFAQVDVTLFANQSHALIEESHEMDYGDYWEFDCAAGWQARKAICVTHGRMAAHGGPEVRTPRSLATGQTRMGDTLLNLQSRWTQAYDEGWFFACHDDRNALGAIPCHAARWHWPHNNLIEVKVRGSGDYAGLRCPTFKGRRSWLLVAGAVAAS